MTEQAPLSNRRSFATHVLSLKKWEKNFLLLGVFVAIAGAAIRAHTWMSGDTVDSITHRLSPTAMRVGMSIVLGFILGWALRSALRLALSLGIILVLIWWGISYMGWADADVNLMSLAGSLRKASGWVEGQADKVVALAKTYIPSAFGGTLGLLVGFRRR